MGGITICSCLRPWPQCFRAVLQMVHGQPLLPLLTLKSKNRVTCGKAFHPQTAKQFVPFLIVHSHLDIIFNIDSAFYPWSPILCIFFTIRLSAQIKKKKVLCLWLKGSLLSTYLVVFILLPLNQAYGISAFYSIHVNTWVFWLSTKFFKLQV